MNEENTAAVTTALIAIPADVHKWLKLQAVERGTSIKTQAVEAFDLLRRQREMDSEHPAAVRQ